MELKLQAGEFCNVQLPSGGVVQIERSIDELNITHGSYLLYTEVQEPVVGWVETFPCRQPTKEPSNVARELRTNEAKQIAEKIRYAVPSVVFWADKSGWPMHYVDADGTQVYAKMLEHDTSAKLILRIAPDGKRTLIVENI